MFHGHDDESLDDWLYGFIRSVLTPKGLKYVTEPASKPPSQRPQEHPWFQAIDFEKLLKREIEMPFKPKVKSETDASNFDAYFTSEAPQVSPTEGGALDPSSDAAFKNFDTVKK